MVDRWLLLVYRIPRQPSAGRVFAWRKLKQLGAIAIQDAVWVLPLTPRNQEHFQWLAAEIIEMKGEAMLWSAAHLEARDTDALQQQFTELVESEYRDILATLKKKDRDLQSLSKRFQDVQSRDYFGSPLGELTRARLVKAEGPSQS